MQQPMEDVMTQACIRIVTLSPWALIGSIVLGFIGFGITAAMAIPL